MPAKLTLEHYEVLVREDGTLHELGHGAMGITYKGIDTRLRVPVALKVINSAHLHSERARLRFVREARSAAQLRHRNVASVFHLGEQDGNYFYAMEYIDGETVEGLVQRQGPLAPTPALRLTAQVARALNAAQARDLVHRDIKPSNLMVVLEDDDLVVKVIDFGLAKVACGDEESGEEPLTRGGFLGTPHFASPEQLEEGEIDVRADIYSLGVTLWYVLRGKTPFTGSMARVVGQHLSKPPPFDDLASLPSFIVELLRRMLAKLPADRPQTPLDLRREIERCLKILIEPGHPAPARHSETQPGSSLELLTLVPDDTRFETGRTIASRYLITQDLGENEAGDSFRARDLQCDREVRLLTLHGELVADRETFSRIEREVGAITALDHPHVLEVFGLATTPGHAAFLTLGWTDGFTLRDLLRTRRELELPEVLRLLQPAASGLDYAVAQLSRLEIGLHHIFIHFPGRTIPTEDLLSRSVDDWGSFSVKINPLATWRELFAITWAAGQTQVGGSASADQPPRDKRAAAVRAFAAIAYELLGGVSACLRVNEYPPLAALDEAGNAVLRRGLSAPEEFASAADFLQQLPAPQAPSAPATTQLPAESGPSPEVATFFPAEPEFPTVVVPEEPASLEAAAAETIVPQPILAEPSRRRPLALIIAIAALAALTAYAIHRLPHRVPPPSLALVTPQPSVPPTATPASTPIRLAALPTALPTLRPSTPQPTPLPSPTPMPTPTRRALANHALQAAEKLAAAQKIPEALAAWLRMEREFPEWDTGRIRAEIFLNELRRRPAGITRQDFLAMEPQIRAAAKLGVLAAMLTLGEGLRESAPEEAFGWFCAAAEGGEPVAMTQAGLMLTAGDGTPGDLAKAAAYFHSAADKGQSTAMAALAECFLGGKGVPEDKAQAVALLRRAAEHGNIQATNRLGWCFHHGVGVARDEKEAFRLYSKAAEQGWVEAIGNLGTLYMKGEGVTKNEAKGVEKLAEAAHKGDVNGMCYYAVCLELGLGLKANPALAKTWYQKAAAAGHPQAIEWCKAQNIPVR